MLNRVTEFKWRWKAAHDSQDSSVFFGLQVVHAKLLGAFGVSRDLMLMSSLLRMTQWLLTASNVMPHRQTQTDRGDSGILVLMKDTWHLPEPAHWGRRPAETLVLIVLNASKKVIIKIQNVKHFLFCRHWFASAPWSKMCCLFLDAHRLTNIHIQSICGCLYSVKPAVCCTYGLPVEGSVHCW